MKHFAVAAFALILGTMSLEGCAAAGGQGTFFDGTKWCGAGNMAMSYGDVGA